MAVVAMSMESWRTGNICFLAAQSCMVMVPVLLTALPTIALGSQLGAIGSHLGQKTIGIKVLIIIIMC